MNGSSASAKFANKQQQQQAFRRTAASLLDEQLPDEPDEDATNDLVESISQSLRQGQQIKPIAYEEGPCYSASLEKLKSKYIVLTATAPPNESATSGTSSTSFGGLSSKVSNTALTMNGGGSMKLFSSQSTPNSTGGKSSGANVLHQHQQQNGVPACASGTTTATTTTTTGGRMDSSSNASAAAALPTPKRTLFPRENVQIGWKTTGRKWLVGAGMMNMGNTCYLNSTLQALFHVPAIANWLLSDEPHRAKCDDGGSVGSCIICAMAKTLLESQSNQSAFRPYLVYSKLRLVCKHLVPGRQEDAHEFLRYLVEAMEKSYLSRSKNSKELDQYSKETTPLNQILGGYLRSEVKCLSCQHVSTTFQHFEDLLLDIRKASSIDEALEHYFARERLEEMGYKCEACKRRVAATKQFSLERAPFVLCVQLKRFSVLGGKINKHVELRSKLDLTPFSSPAMRSTGGKLMYRLTSMVTHLGNTQHCGHYTAIGHTDAGGYHVFDDSNVRPIGIHSVMSTNAYILFYELESVAAGAVGLTNGACRAKATVTIGQPSSTATLTSMGHLSNGGNTPGTAGSSGSGAGTSGSGGSSGTGGTPGKASHSPSPLRVLGTGGGNGAAGGLFPSKLEQKCGFIGPVLPSVAAAAHQTTAATSTTTKQTSNGGNGHHAAQSITTTSVLSTKSVPDQADHFSSPSSTASTLSNAAGSPMCSPVKHHPGSKLSEAPKSKSLSMPKLGTGTNGNVVSLVPYDSDDTNSATSEDEEREPTTTAKSIVLTNGGGGGGGGKRIKTLHTPFTNGKRPAVKKEEDVEDEDDDDDDEEEDERTETSSSSRSPQMIKTNSGLWKVSKSSTADQLSQPESGSSSASSSKSCSPATSGGSSPANSPAPKPKPPHLPIIINGGAGGNNHQRQSTNGSGGGGGKTHNKLLPTVNGAASSSNTHHNGEQNGNGSTVQQLLKFSHRGYGAPVKSWNGQQTTMERELANDRREERKRQFEDDRETDMDRGRVKKTKSGAVGSALSANGASSSSNPFQQYQNHGGKWMGGNGNGNRPNFHNHHNGHNQSNGYRGGGGGGQGYYQNGNGHNRHHGGGGGGFRNGGAAAGGGRRFGGGGRNGDGFHTKAHHHHQRSEQGSGMAGGGSNGFYHR